MRPFILLTLGLIVWGAFLSQAADSKTETNTVYAVTNVNGEGRFEILQSRFWGRIVLKLDKFTGATFYLDDRGTWRRLRTEKDMEAGITPANGQAIEPLPNPNQINYQLFSSIISDGPVILANIHTGKSWGLNRRRTEIFWSEIPSSTEPN